MVANSPGLEEFFRTAHHKLLDLQRRQFALEAFDREHQAATRGKEYWIANDVVWTAMLDVRDKNVIDFASWAVGAYTPGGGGLFGLLKARYLPDLPPKRKWGRTDAEDGHLRELTDKGFTEARARLFPSAAGRKVRHEDVDELITIFEQKLRPLVDDRHRNRANVHEGKNAGNAKMLELLETQELYRYGRSVLNDLCLVSMGATWEENDMNFASVGDTAEELVDMIVLPRWFRRETAKAGLSREAVYEALHADPAVGHFNEQAKLEALADRSDPAADAKQIK